MGLFKKQMANVIEWKEFNDEMLFWKWKNEEIKKGSRLIIHPGQDAIFMYNGKVEGIFEDEGVFDVESEIVPFLSSLKGIKFGFNSGIRAEVLFINTKEILVKWGTKNAINIPTPKLAGGMPIRAFGTFTCRICDADALIEKVAGVKDQYTIDDVKERVISYLDALLMKWISSEGKDLFNIQANSIEISAGIRDDLDMEMRKIGISITSFAISSVSYPQEVQDMIQKMAKQSFVEDMGKYQQMAFADSMEKGGGTGNAAASMAATAAGLKMGMEMVDGMMGGSSSSAPASSGGANFCPNCGAKAAGAKFCPNCGQKL